MLLCVYEIAIFPKLILHNSSIEPLNRISCYVTSKNVFVTHAHTHCLIADAIIVILFTHFYNAARNVMSMIKIVNIG